MKPSDFGSRSRVHTTELITSRNVNGAFSQGMELIEKKGVLRSSRNGDVLEICAPVITEYTKPDERVLFCDARHANPFFHFMEGIWMLSGSDDLSFIAKYNKRMEEMSDDGKTLSGSYGYRWIVHFDFNQIEAAVELLRRNRDDRRVVVTHWDPSFDFGNYASDVSRDMPVPKDMPCNTHIYFYVRDNELTMTVCNRSNDMIWGAYGANAVHMSMLHEYVSTATGIELGRYYQISNSFHVYKSVWDDLYPRWKKTRPRAERQYPPFYDPYIADDLSITPLVSYPDTFLSECHDFISSEVDGSGGEKIIYKNDIFPGLVLPMKRAWDLHKSREYSKAVAYCIENMDSEDWAVACVNWLLRTEKQWTSSQK